MNKIGRLTRIRDYLPTLEGLGSDNPDWDNDAYKIAAEFAFNDMTWLVAEVERLRAEDAELRRVNTIYAFLIDDQQTTTELSTQYLREAPQTEPALTNYLRRVSRGDEDDVDDGDLVFLEPKREATTGILIGSRRQTALPDITDQDSD